MFYEAKDNILFLTSNSYDLIEVLTVSLFKVT